MSAKKMTVTVNYQKKLADGVYSMWLAVGPMADEAKPGQFISIYSNDSSRLLPRPISICEVDKEFRSIRVVYRIAGAGTEEFSHLKAGQRVDIMGPFGKWLYIKPGRPRPAHCRRDRHSAHAGAGQIPGM